MRIPNSRTHRDVNESMSMTPMIDVVFLLLVFFVCASIGQVRELILPADMEVPGASAEIAQPVEKEIWEDDIWVKLVRTDGNTIVRLNDRDTDFDRLDDQLNLIGELGKSNPIILDIDDAVPLRDVIRAYDACRRVGFQSVSFAALPVKSVAGT